MSGIALNSSVLSKILVQCFSNFFFDVQPKIVNHIGWNTLFSETTYKPLHSLAYFGSSGPHDPGFGNVCFAGT